MIRRTLAALMMLAAGVYAGSGNVATAPATQAATHPVDLVAAYPKAKMPKSPYEWTTIQRDLFREWAKTNIIGKDVAFMAQVVSAAKDRNGKKRFLIVAKSMTREVWGLRMGADISVGTDNDDIAIGLVPGSAVYVTGRIASGGLTFPRLAETSDGRKPWPGFMSIAIDGDVSVGEPLNKTDLAACMIEKRVITGMLVRDAFAAMGPAEKNTFTKDAQQITWLLREPPKWLKLNEEHGADVPHRVFVDAEKGKVHAVRVERVSFEEEERLRRR